MTTTWKKEIECEMLSHDETWEKLVTSTFVNGEELIGFDAGYGGVNGIPFTAWTKKRVYFPVCYDGAEWCGSVSRIPNSVPSSHVGGG